MTRHEGGVNMSGVEFGGMKARRVSRNEIRCVLRR